MYRVVLDLNPVHQVPSVLTDGLPWILKNSKKKYTLAQASCRKPQQQNLFPSSQEGSESLGKLFQALIYLNQSFKIQLYSSLWSVSLPERSSCSDRAWLGTENVAGDTRHEAWAPGFTSERCVGETLLAKLFLNQVKKLQKQKNI